MKLSPMPKRRTTKRKTRTPRCSIQRCGKRAEIRGWCITHAENRADRLFSRWIRDRDGRCTAAGVLDGQCKGILQAAHINGRRKMSVRFDPRNVHTACAAHHYLIDQHGREAEKQVWAISILGRAEYDRLMLDALVHHSRRLAIEEALAWLTGGDQP